MLLDDTFNHCVYSNIDKELKYPYTAKRKDEGKIDAIVLTKETALNFQMRKVEGDHTCYFGSHMPQ